MRVLVTGAAGQLAADLVATFQRAGHSVTALSRLQLDVTDEGAVAALLERERPDVVVNPAAYNRVDDAEREIAQAFAANAFGPRALAIGAARQNATLVHYSTDYVFDGLARRPYTEGDPATPLSAYATSKLCGEQFVAALAPRQYVMRVCGLFGPAGRSTRQGNFVEKMLRAAEAGRPLRVVADQIVAPTSTKDVAAATLQLVENQAPYGLYHCTAAGETSWYEYARAIFALAEMTPRLDPVSAAEFGAPARRPAYSILDNGKLVAAGATRPRPWQEALGEYMVERKEDRAV